MIAPTRTGPTSERRAALWLALAGAATLWFGTEVTSRLATHSVLGVTRTHATQHGFETEQRPSEYAQLFSYVVAPLRRDTASTIRSIRIEMEDLMPLPFGKGYL